MVRRRSVERWLGEEVWKEGKEKKCGKRVRRRSEERWLREEVWKV